MKRKRKRLVSHQVPAKFISLTPTDDNFSFDKIGLVTYASPMRLSDDCQGLNVTVEASGFNSIFKRPVLGFNQTDWFTVV